jgi:hypothetical protein
MDDEPTGHADRAQVVRARRAVAETWKNRGGPEPPRTEADYRIIQQRLADYLAVAFPGIAESSRAGIVVETVESHMAQLLAHPSRPHGRSRARADRGSECDLLAGLADDAALELLAGGEGPTSFDGRERFGPSESDDEWLAQLAIGAVPDAVRAGLRELVKLGAGTDFRIVTQYLDLADRDRTRPPRSAEVVAHLGDETLSEHRVRQSILAFRDRLAQIEARDGRR